MKFATGGDYYVSSIKVSFALPNVIITSNLTSGPAAFFASFSFGLVRPVTNANRVKLDKNTSSTVDIYVAKGDDIGPYDELLQIVLDQVLPVSRLITVQWLGDRIYLYGKPIDRLTLSAEERVKARMELNRVMSAVKANLADQVASVTPPTKPIEPTIQPIKLPSDKGRLINNLIPLIGFIFIIFALPYIFDVLVAILPSYIAMWIDQISGIVPVIFIARGLYRANRMLHRLQDYGRIYAVRTSMI